MIDEAENGTFLTIETFLDNQDTIVGRAFTVEMEGEELEAHYITVTEDGKFAFDARQLRWPSPARAPSRTASAPAATLSPWRAPIM